MQPTADVVQQAIGQAADEVYQDLLAALGDAAGVPLETLQRFAGAASLEEIRAFPDEDPFVVIELRLLVFGQSVPSWTLLTQESAVKLLGLPAQTLADGAVEAGHGVFVGVSEVVDAFNTRARKRALAATAELVGVTAYSNVSQWDAATAESSYVMCSYVVFEKQLGAHTVAHLVAEATLQSLAEASGGVPEETAPVVAPAPVEAPVEAPAFAPLLEATEAEANDADIREVEFTQLADAVTPLEATKLQLLADVPLEFAVQLGRATRTIKEVLALGAGALIALDKLQGEPLDVLVNGFPIAKGEVVTIDDHFGIRITEVVSPRKRLGGVKS